MQLSLLVGQPRLRADVESGATVRLKGLACVMDGSKVCPFGTCALPHPGHLPLAAQITDGIGNPCRVLSVELASGPGNTQRTGAASHRRFPGWGLADMQPGIWIE